jgi:predicted permease
MLALLVVLFVKILPLSLLIVFGVIAGRWLGLTSQHMAGLMIYLLTPVIVFTGALNTPLTRSLLVLPLLVWSLAAINGLLFYWLGKLTLRDNRANILALAVACGNTGYFGIPVALTLLGAENLGLYVVVMLGVTLYENSLGFYLAAKGRFSARDAFLKVLRLPSLYAFFAALLLQHGGFSMPVMLQPVLGHIQGAYVVLGMMIIGIGIARLQPAGLSAGFLGLLLAGKFLGWPLLALLAVFIDRTLLHLYSPLVHQALLLVSLMPIAANTVVIASLLNVHPQRMATATLISTVLAMFSIPLCAYWLGIGQWG